MSILIIGSHLKATAEYYKQLNLDPSVLVDSTVQEYTIGHTSIQDLNNWENLEIVAKKASTIYWADSSASEFRSQESYIDTVFWLKNFNRKYQKVKNFHSVQIDYRAVKNLQPVQIDPYKINTTYCPTVDQLVVFGCSFTAGAALPDPTTHYANILGNRLGKQVYNLSQAGGSNDLIFNRFVNTQWNQGQTVVIQLTSPYRLYYCNDDYKKYNIILSNEIKNQTLHRSLLEVYQHPWIFSQLLDKIRAIEQIAVDNKLKLALWFASDDYSKQDQTYFHHMKSYVPTEIMKHCLVDFGTDDLHPGIESNQNIADTLYNFISDVY